jgi:hypothetical protein
MGEKAVLKLSLKKRARAKDWIYVAQNTVRYSTVRSTIMYRQLK